MLKNTLKKADPKAEGVFKFVVEIGKESDWEPKQLETIIAVARAEPGQEAPCIASAVVDGQKVSITVQLDFSAAKGAKQSSFQCFLNRNTANML